LLGLVLGSHDVGKKSKAWLVLGLEKIECNFID